MPRADIEILARELGTDLPEAFDALSKSELAALTAAMRAARSRQKNQLDGALSKALEHVPALMRGPIRRILGL